MIKKQHLDVINSYPYGGKQNNKSKTYYRKLYFQSNYYKENISVENLIRDTAHDSSHTTSKMLKFSMRRPIIMKNLSLSMMIILIIIRREYGTLFMNSWWWGGEPVRWSCWLCWKNSEDSWYQWYSQIFISILITHVRVMNFS